MQLFTLDPLLDPRWDELVASHPQASVFHRTGWLRALAKTYDYRPVVLTSSPPGQRLLDGIAFCEVKSWITGSRLVSLPFSDHAQPLLSGKRDTLELAEWVQMARSRFGWKYVELRPVSARPEWSPALESSQSFWMHTLSLEPRIERLYGNLHKDCLRRRIQHAERQHLEYERGASGELIDRFYGMLAITRKRHRLLPQPKSWFENLVSEMSPDAEIRLVRKGRSPIAAIFTLRQRGTVVYKYGCSEHRMHHLGGMPFLFWKLIEESKAEGLEQIDFGRTDSGNRGLAEFKDRLGASRTLISYLRHPKDLRAKPIQLSDRSTVGRLFGLLPGVFSTRLGRLMYRHIG
jgi:CelD/BcsL family acetyltransferase involved in cellulose biosynthesis